MFPVVDAKACDDRVCLSVSDTTNIWMYVRDVQRYEERVAVCTSARPFSVTYRLAPAARRARATGSEVATIVSDMATKEVDVVWVACKEVNGWYVNGLIVMCYEASDENPLLADMIAAHEMGHAQLDALDEHPSNEEELADQIGAVYLGTHGLQMALLVGGAYLLTLPSVPGDVHQDPSIRALNMACWALGSLVRGQGVGEDEQRCKKAWAELLTKWSK